MKKIVLMTVTLFLLIVSICSCTKQSELDPDNPIVLTMWHVYGEQADSPMNRLITEFNETVGKEQGIIINVTMMTNARDIGGLLTSAYENKPGAPEMPDLFTCHSNNVAKIGIENILDWKDLFTEDEIDDFVEDFVKDGMLDDQLAVLPISKSTHLLFMNGTQFELFSKDTGITYENLSTWNGLFDATKEYYTWSGGKTMCVFDYLIRAIELNALEKGGSNFYTEDGWYDFSNASLKESYMEFMRPLVQGYIGVADLYSNTQIMTGETISGIGSSAAILYYNDVVIYPDNTTEPMNLQILPYPHAEASTPLMTQAGVGLCAYKTTSLKAEAISVFAHWLTNAERNLDFVMQTGYMPVCNSSFASITDYDFPDNEHETLYQVLDHMHKNYSALSEPNAADYYDKVTLLYNQIREMQPVWIERAANGEDINVLMEEAWTIFSSIK